MHYVAFVHKDEGSSFGVSIPDVPGCFSAGETLDAAIRNAGEALAFHLEGSAPPAPRPIDRVLADPALADVIGDALIATVELAPDANISLDRGLIEALDTAATERGVSRNALASEAIREALSKR